MFDSKIGLAKAAEKREEGKSKYRTDFSDNAYWQELAKDKNVVLPAWHVEPTPEKMRRWVRRLGLNISDYAKSCGENWTYSDYAKLNPDWSLRPFVGILLEYKLELDAANSINKKHTGA